ncbi:MAG: hypothetical protein HC851_01450 [Acaryochloris sp. RU_4_1]|nr:hypothetical protein [Acaryochloris sp. SU_5_25]NJM64414.1 hypothetical protein [Acaryochloris sp. RU_4_1]
MTQTLTATQHKKGYIKNSSLTLISLAAVFFPRVLISLRAPSLINFVHFALVPLACFSTLSSARIKDRKQIAASKSILTGLFFMLIIVLASALINDAGIVNAILSFLLLTEPFIFLLALISLPLSPENFTRFRAWIFRFAFANIIFCYIQRYLFNRQTEAGLEDNINGVFIGGGAGHVVGASISITFGVYYLFALKSKPLFIRVLVFLAIFNQIIISDTKQVLLAVMAAYVLLQIVNLKDPVKSCLYLVVGSVFLVLFYWAIYNFEALSGFTTWIRPEIYGPDGEATKLKFAAFRIVSSYSNSPLNWLLGIGPGHTVGRLGGWMLESYKELLLPLGATIHPASQAVWQAVVDSWLGDQSSMFSPLFGWAGIWGDLGILGLGAYLYLSFLIWTNICSGNISRLLVLSAFVFGCILSQLEEPAYMMFLAAIVGLEWHEQRHKNFTKVVITRT